MNAFFWLVLLAAGPARGAATDLPIAPLGVHWRIADWASGLLPGPSVRVRAGVPDAAAETLETWRGERFAVRVRLGRAEHQRRQKTLAAFEGHFLGVVDRGGHRGLLFELGRGSVLRVRDLVEVRSEGSRVTLGTHAIDERSLTVAANDDRLVITVWPHSLSDTRWVGISMSLVSGRVPVSALQRERKSGHSSAAEHSP